MRALPSKNEKSRPLHNLKKEFDMTRKKWRLRRHFCSLRLPMQTSIWIRMAPELNQDVWRGQKNFQATSFTMSQALLMLGSPWQWGWPQSSTQMSGGVRKNFQMTNFTMLNNISSMKYSLKSVPGLADVGVLHGDGDGPRTPPRCLEGSGKSFK